MTPSADLSIANLRLPNTLSISESPNLRELTTVQLTWFLRGPA
jgi:hypothetical protein